MLPQDDKRFRANFEPRDRRAPANGRRHTESVMSSLATLRYRGITAEVSVTFVLFTQRP